MGMYADAMFVAYNEMRNEFSTHEKIHHRGRPGWSHASGVLTAITIQSFRLPHLPSRQGVIPELGFPPIPSVFYLLQRQYCGHIMPLS